MTNQLYNVVSIDSTGYADVEDRFQQINKELKKKDRELIKARELIKVLNKTIGKLTQNLQKATHYKEKYYESRN